MVGAVTTFATTTAADDWTAWDGVPPVIDPNADFWPLVAACADLGFPEDYFDMACPYPGAPIRFWNTSLVTDMSRDDSHYRLDAPLMFFNERIGSWDTSRVTDMSRMLEGCSNFNEPIKYWDTSSVTSMFAMFRGLVRDFDQPIEAWDTSNVRNMSQMFSGAESFNQPLGDWDTSSVEDTSRMFREADKFNQPLDSWDVSSVTNHENMFYNARSFAQAKPVFPGDGGVDAADSDPLPLEDSASQHRYWILPPLALLLLLMVWDFC